MTQEPKVPRFNQILGQLQDLFDRKNNNYASDKDPFTNLRAVEQMDIPAYKGCLIRMLDKMSRLIELSKGKEDLVDESFIDTLRDLAVYAILCEILYEERVN